ncbi:MAG: DUF2190 family protein [Bdellovibrionaceae bacterium]|nr:DUF2190 family protein [Pseudobdellovibrionaceae bacterium]
MKTKVHNIGDSRAWVNDTGVAVSSGDVVRIGQERMAIATVDIAISGTGIVDHGGVHRLAKVASTAIAQGARVYWDATEEEVTTTILGNYYLGRAFRAAGADDTTVDVRLEAFSQEGPRYVTSGSATPALGIADFLGGGVAITLSVAGAATLTLPSVADIPVGATLLTKKTGSAGAITIDPAGSETINGGSTHATQDAQNDLAMWVNTGAAWILGPSVIA